MNFWEVQVSDCEGEKSDRERSKRMERCVNAIDVMGKLQSFQKCVCVFFWWVRENVCMYVCF